MVECLLGHIDSGKIGIICPRVSYRGWHDQQKVYPVSEDIEACMTSGSLTNVEAWAHIGRFNEEYFIDFVDNEFCKRLKLQDYRVVRVNTCSLEHRLGDANERVITKYIRLRCFKHVPWRCYYITRNHLLYIQTYKNDISVVIEKLRLFYNVSVEILQSDDRKEAIKYIKLGIKDAKSGITGQRLHKG